MTPLRTASTPVIAVQPLAKTFSQQPEAEHRTADGKLRRRDDGQRMACAATARYGAHGDHDSSVPTKRYVGIRKATPVSLTPRILTSVRISRMSEAERQRVRLQLREGRHQGADAGRDADRRVEDVVDHQRRGGEQSGVVAQVLAGHRVAAAAVRDRPRWSGSSEK